MSVIQNILANLPEVKGPAKKHLSFKEKLKWTSMMLVAFFVLSIIPLFGLGQNSLARFEQLSIILGASFGSLISLGIGPIVTASIVLQLLNGSGLLKFDLTTTEGKRNFQGLQKLLSIFFILFEAIIYVYTGGLAPSAGLVASTYSIMQMILVFQLFVGGMLILYMDEVMTKWGFGSGVSLFIAAGVSAEIFIRAFSPLNATGSWAFGSGQAPVGQIWVFLISIINNVPAEAILALITILSTVVIFVFSVYAQSMKVEIPLSFGRVRGYGIRWPLKFIYTSNIPVILIAALIANIQLWASLLERSGHAWLGTFSNNVPVSGFVAWINPPNLVQEIFTSSLSMLDIGHAAVYFLFLIGGSVLFSIFWVQTSGMDAANLSKQIMDSGLQIPGFRRDPRVLETILSRYITPLTVMGAIVVGFLAASADLLGSLSRGTGILLAVMIIYKLYEDIAQQHMLDMHPALRKMMGGSA